MEQLKISCDIIAEQQCRAEEKRSACSALKENPQVWCLIIDTVLRPKSTYVS